MTTNEIRCYGRDSLIKNILISARRNGAVLLFGGRQAGKTTLLLHLCNVTNKRKANAEILDDIDIAIYVDLMTLPYDANPSDFFRLLFEKTILQCREQISGFDHEEYLAKEIKDFNLENFVDNLIKVKSSCKEVNAHLIFILDESKRVLGDRFPRGFQDNIFTLLYGESVARCPRISIVFSGGQHLYKFSQDDTSPIGSRAGYQFVRNLTMCGVGEIINNRFPGLQEDVASKTLSEIMSFTGGQAGLVAKTIAAIKSHGSCDDFLSNIVELKDELSQQNFGLFENWALALTAEGRDAWSGFSIDDEISISGVSKVLNRNGKDRFLAQRTLDELQYMGLAAPIDGRVRKVNEAFLEFAVHLGFECDNECDNSQPENDIPLWKLIEQTELALRDVIEKKYVEQFGEKSEEVMATILGKETWGKISAMKEKSAKSYPYSRVVVERDSLSCMYFGNLMSLMVNGKMWACFKAMFRDKRHVEDIISSIIPVRNDSAHFAAAPDKEMARCQIHCDDLLVIVEREIEKMLLAKETLPFSMGI